MTPNPFLGVLLHAIGGFAAGSFYAPLNRVRQWAWESFWLLMGLAAWLAAPWVVARLTTPDLFGVLAAAPGDAWTACIVFGLLWGIIFHEWRGTSLRTKALVGAGILTLIASTMVIGYGNYLGD